MPFSSNFYLFVFGNVIENRMTKKQGIPLAKGVGGCSISYGKPLSDNAYVNQCGTNIPLAPFIRGR